MYRNLEMSVLPLFVGVFEFPVRSAVCFGGFTGMIRPVVFRCEQAEQPIIHPFLKIFQ